MFDFEKTILPEFPRTLHLPHKVNAARDDLIATAKDASVIFTSNVVAESKIDGANSGICHYEDQPIIRNRNHILRKGYGRKRTNAKIQFAPIWNWYYQNIEKFEKLNNALGFYASVYGEWMNFTGSIFYDKLPDYFIAYDIWDSEKGHFVATPQARKALADAGFSMPEVLQQGIKSYDELTKYVEQIDPWAAEPALQSRPENSKREGVYVKVFDSEKILHRFKMVRPGFLPGENFTGHRNSLAD